MIEFAWDEEFDWDEESSPPSIETLRSEAWYLGELAVLEACRIVVKSIVPDMKDRGFEYYVHTAEPVMPISAACYLPPKKASYQERLDIGLQRNLDLSELQGAFGRHAIWLGPQESERWEFPNLTESEQRGFWVNTKH